MIRPQNYKGQHNDKSRIYHRKACPMFYVIIIAVCPKMSS